MREYGSEFEFVNHIFDSGISDFLIENDKCGRLGLFRSCRDGLRYLAKQFEGTILLPDLCCESMTEPFVNSKMSTYFYTVGCDFLPKESIIESINKVNADYVFVMSYYDSDYASIIDMIRTHCQKTEIIVDLTQKALDILELTNELSADYFVASLRKTIPLLNGGIIISSNKLASLPIYKENAFTEYRKEAFNLKQLYHFNRNEAIKANYRDKFRLAEASLDDGDIVAACPDTLNTLKYIDFQYIARARRENYKALYKGICHNKSIEFICSYKRYVPFCMPILLKNRDRIQCLLAERGVYSQVLWPLSSNNASDFARTISNNMLAIPVDQRYSPEDMLDIARIINEVVRG